MPLFLQTLLSWNKKYNLRFSDSDLAIIHKPWGLLGADLSVKFILIAELPFSWFDFIWSQSFIKIKPYSRLSCNSRKVLRCHKLKVRQNYFQYVGLHIFDRNESSQIALFARKLAYLFIFNISIIRCRFEKDYIISLPKH